MNNLGEISRHTVHNRIWLLNDLCRLIHKTIVVTNTNSTCVGVDNLSTANVFCCRRNGDILSAVLLLQLQLLQCTKISRRVCVYLLWQNVTDMNRAWKMLQKLLIYEDFQENPYKTRELDRSFSPVVIFRFSGILCFLFENSKNIMSWDK